MALTQLQSDILRCLAKNRSETSYLAGGLMLNKNWQRRSDDIDIFHDADEEVAGAAKADLAILNAAGYQTHIDVLVYGCADATVSDGKSATIIQWFSETKRRFFPLVKARSGARGFIRPTLRSTRYWRHLDGRRPATSRTLSPSLATIVYSVLWCSPLQESPQTSLHGARSTRYDDMHSPSQPRSISL